MLTISSTLNLGPLKNFVKEFREEARKVILMTAFSIEADAKINTTPNVDTGALRASIYTITYRGSGRDSALQEAQNLFQKKNPGVSPPVASENFPEVGELTAVVSVGMSYGIYVEYGTVKSAAYPFLIPAAEKNKELFNKGMAEAVKNAGLKAGWNL